MKKKRSKIILIALTLFPPISYLVMYVLNKTFTIHRFKEGLPDYTTFEIAFAFFDFFTPFLGYTLAFFYLFLILTNEGIAKVKKLLWFLVMIIPKANIIPMLFYLYLYERKTPPENLPSI